MPDSARVHGRTHTHAHTPRNLRSSLERRQDTSEGGTWPERGHRLKSPPCWLCASVSPLGAGHPAPSRCPASPQRHRYSPVPGYPSPALCHRAHPLHPKSTDSGSASARSTPHPTSPIPQPSPGFKRDAATESRSHGTGIWGSVLLRCLRASSWEPEQPREPAPSRARAMVAPGPRPPCHPRDGTALLSATPNPRHEHVPRMAPNSRGTLTS